MHPNTIKPYINMMLLANKNGMVGTQAIECTEGLFDLIAQALEPFGCTISPYKSHSIDDAVYRYQTEVIGPILQGSTSVILTVELLPHSNRWQVFATFNPGNHGQSDIIDNLKDNNICGDGFVYHLVYNVAHKACIDKVKKSLQIDQKVTMNTDSLEPLGEKLPMETFSYSDVNVQSGQWVSSRSCGEIVAEHLDDLTVTGISEHGDVTFEERNRKIPFTLTPEEAVAMLHL